MTVRVQGGRVGVALSVLPGWLLGAGSAGSMALFGVVEWSSVPFLPSTILAVLLIQMSDRQVTTMPWVTARCRDSVAWALSLTPLVISGVSAIDLLADDTLFTGFDELRIPAGLPVAQPPDDALLVAPQELDIECPAGVLKWLDASGCRLGVGDGYGMNYVLGEPVLGNDLGLA